MTIEASVDIAAPPDRIWAIMSDVERWPEWTPTVTSVEMLDRGPVRPGTRARIRQPRLPAAVWTVTAVEPGRRFTWESRTTGLKSVGDHRIEPRGTSTMSRVVVVLQWSGWLTPLVRLVFGKLSRRYVQTEAESLKRRCEIVNR